MKISLLKLTSFFILLSFSLITRGQSPFQPNVNVPSPNASSLGQYGEVPISLFTGVPNIGVPIYTVQEGGYKLPISLSYHYSGIRPNVCPGSTGANWTLMAGGAITRVIKGFADEGNSPNSNFLIKNYGFLFNNQLPPADELSAVLSSNSNFYNYLGLYAQPPFNASGSLLWDLDPDEFDFNVCGISGSFYLDQTGAMRVKCDRDVKVSYNAVLDTPFIVKYLNATGSAGEPGKYIDKTFSTFTITDEDGTQYIFGQYTNGSNTTNSEAIEYSTGWADNTFRATSWYLTTILLTNGKTISFNYDRGPFTTQLDKTYNIITGGAAGNCPPLTFVPGAMTEPTTMINSGLTYSASILSPIYLTGITTSSGTTVNLNYALSQAQYYSADSYYKVLQQIDPTTFNTPYPMSGENQGENKNYLFWAASYHFATNTGSYCDFGIPYYKSNSQIFGATPTSIVSGVSATNYFTRLFNWLKLTGITVTDNFNNVGIRNFGLVYDETGRLKLTQLQNMDSQGNLINSYKFAYNTTAMSLPPLLTDQTDHWGYYNYNGQNYTTQNFTKNTYIANKATFITDQSLIAEKAEILKTITYPTGGTTTLEPDNNYFAKVIDKNNPKHQYDSLGYCGGVRIKRITNRDAQGNVLTSKTYFYLHGYQNGIDTTTLASSGELAALPQYWYHSDAMPTTTALNNQPNSPPFTVQFSQFGTQPIIPASQNNLGSFIGYSEVAEVGADGSYSISKFTNYSDGTAYQDALPDISANNTSNPNELYPLPNNDNSEMRGHLKSLTQYNANNLPASQKTFDQFQLVYSALGQNQNVRSIYGGELFVTCGYLCVLGGTNTFDLGTLVPTRETDLLYNPDGSYVQNVTNTSYNINFKKVSQKSSTASDGTLVTTTFSYPFNYTDPVSAAMVNNNIVSPVVNETVQKSSANVQVTQDVYQQWHSDANPAVNLYLPGSTQIQIGNNPIETRQNYLAYDPWGNLTAEAKPGGPNSSYQWGYNNQYPVVKIENAANTLNTSTTTTTGTGNTNVTLPQTGGFTTYTTTFTVVGTAPTSLILSFSGYPNPPSNPIAVVNCTITGTLSAGGTYNSGNLQFCICAGSASCSGGVNTRTLNLSPGQYTMSAVYSVQPTLSCSLYLQATFPTSTTTTTTTGIKEFYFEGFEESAAGTTGSAHTGNKSYSGATYTVNWTVPNSRSYVISYWYLNAAGIWKYVPETAYTGPSKVLSSIGAVAYDDIRIYPVDALMATYTYNPLIGMTSSTDPKGMTTYYEYDSFQRLSNIKDKDGNIIKHIDYHYQGN